MINSRKMITIILSTAVLLAACQNSSEGANPESSGKAPDTHNDASGNSSEGAGNSQPTEQDKPGDNPKTPGTNPGESSGQEGGAAEHSKDQYLQKLNQMEEADRNEAAGATMVELEQQEAARYKKWDQKLNEIYGALKEQLSAEQMDQLKEEQRRWMKQRDEAAKQSALKHEGGSAEKLEYVATQAELTRERCYALVSKYMN